MKREPAAASYTIAGQALCPRARPRAQSGHDGAKALVCRKSPVRLCRAAGAISASACTLASPTNAPCPAKGATITPVNAVTGVLHCGSRVFVQKRPPAGVWGNLWEFPGGRVEADESPEQASACVNLWKKQVLPRVWPGATASFATATTYRLTLHCFGLNLNPASADTPPLLPQLTAATECRWVSPQELNELAMPAAHRKLADRRQGLIRMQHSRPDRQPAIRNNKKGGPKMARPFSRIKTICRSSYSSLQQSKARSCWGSSGRPS